MTARSTTRSTTCDAVITSGGVSVGDFDYVERGAGAARRRRSRSARRSNWYQVAIRPAKPLCFSFVRGTPVFGLPGQPGVVAGELRALRRAPRSARLAGHADVNRPRAHAPAPSTRCRAAPTASSTSIVSRCASSTATTSRRASAPKPATPSPPPPPPTPSPSSPTARHRSQAEIDPTPRQSSQPASSGREAQRPDAHEPARERTECARRSLAKRASASERRGSAKRGGRAQFARARHTTRTQEEKKRAPGAMPRALIFPARLRRVARPPRSSDPSSGRPLRRDAAAPGKIRERRGRNLRHRQRRRLDVAIGHDPAATLHDCSAMA